MWAQRYAQTRVLPQIWSFVVFILVFAALGGLSYLTGVLWRSFHPGMAVVTGIGALVMAGLILFGSIYFSVPKWGGRKMERWAEEMYGGEGHAGLTDPERMRAWKKTMLVVAIVFGLCNVSLVLLGLAGVLPERLMQPTSALYVVPFLVILFAVMRPTVSPLVLLWPALYAVHAALILAGVFSGVGSVHMYVPIAGYGLLTMLLNHGYNRYALRRLRKATSGK